MADEHTVEPPEGVIFVTLPVPEQHVGAVSAYVAELAAAEGDEVSGFMLGDPLGLTKVRDVGEIRPTRTGLTGTNCKVTGGRRDDGLPVDEGCGDMG